METTFNAWGRRTSQGGRSIAALYYDPTPAVFPGLQAVAALLGGDVMQAAMPTMIGVMALIGVVVASLTQRAFALSRATSIAIAAVMISGPLFRYTSGNYFLSQLMGSLVLLLLLSRTLAVVGDNRPKGWAAVAASFAPHYILIYYLYPVLVVIAVGLQVILVAGIGVLPTLRGQEAKEVGSMRAMVTEWGIGISIGLVVVAAVDPVHFEEMVRRIFLLSKFHAGWPLALISPAAIIGLPVGLEVTTQTAQIASTIAFLAVSTVIGYWYVVRGADRGPVAGRVLFLIAVLVFAVYSAYFCLTGASYQQWKLATYLPLLMSFAWWGACFTTMRATIKSERVFAMATLSLCACVVVGNLLNYAIRQPPMRTFSASYANLRALDVTGNGADLYVRMSSFAGTFFPVYFVRHRTLHLLSDSYYPKENLDLANVSPAWPLLVEGKECKPETAWTTTVVGVGCLHRQPPTLEFGLDYRLSEPLPVAIEAEGLSVQEVLGRWSDGDRVAFRLSASRADLSNAPVGFVNFQFHPYAGRRGSQRVALTWGGRHAEEVVDQLRTFSLPYVRDDWNGADVQAMTITMDLPDATSPNSVDPGLHDARKLAIKFITMGVTSVPLGSVIRGAP